MVAPYVQQFLWIFLFASLINGHVEANSRALRKLNKQFNLLRRSVERDIEDLTYEVSDLQTQLELERERTSTLVELLNSTDLTLPNLVGGESTNSRDLIDKYSTLEKEVSNLKKENKQLKKTAEAHTREITDAKRDIRALNDSATQLADAIESNSKPFAVLENELKESIEDIASVMTKALSDKKKQLRDLQNKLVENHAQQVELDLEANVDQILSNHSILVDLDRVQASCAGVGNITEELKSEIVTIRDEVDEVVRSTGLNRDKLETLASCCKAKAVVAQKIVATAVSISTVTPNITSSTQSGDYLVYAVFGEDITKNIRIGSRVIRGKDWSWLDQDGGGPGTVTGWVRNDPGTKEVHVRWDAGKQVNYRVGLVKKYDLYLITGGDADHLAGTSTLRFKPIFKADLEAAITIGSRVIRGEDWSWRDQDGGGPGTVTGWYSGKQSTRQVMVDWDLGTKANYRVGAHGKYDLFLLAD